jgi:DNA replication and repair protein RecF
MTPDAPRMFLSHLSLTHFRNYQRLELDFTQRLTLLQGHNAQGKTSLLEAIFLLATSKAVHAQADREVVDWQAQEEPIPFCRVAGVVTGQPGSPARPLELEVIFTPRADGANFGKQVKINGAAKRSLDLVGLLRAVLFLPEDVRLVDGGPSERRRYLDTALCQIDAGYCRALAEYQKVLAQRNSLMKNLRDQAAAPSAAAIEAQLQFWDERLVQHGSVVLARRHNFSAELDVLARQRHKELSGGSETLRLEYLPSFNYGPLSEAEYKRWQVEGVNENFAGWGAFTTSAAEVALRYRAKLAERRSRELAAGATLYGPHRDDLRFVVNGRNLHQYGSRGQQRSAALATKLAEVQAMTMATGAAPLLLLDDVMSELDAQRRSMLLAALEGVQQAIITTTDWDDFTPQFRNAAQRMHVCAGGVQAWTEADEQETVG